MAIFSPLRSRRLAARQTETTQQLIAFQLRQEWFALPIEVVLKAVPVSNVYGDPKRTGVSLTIYQGYELLVIDVGHRIFGEAPEHSELHNRATVTEQRYLLIVQSSNVGVFGLPIDSAPAMRRVPESCFAPLPVTYVAQKNIQCVSSLMIPATEGQPPLFLLDPNQLI